MSYGCFSNSSLKAYTKLVKESSSLDVSTGGTYDFTRCVKSNGEVYGTAGRCKKGVEQNKQAKPEVKSKAAPKGYEKANVQGKIRLTAKIKALPVDELKKVLAHPGLSERQREYLHKRIKELEKSYNITNEVSPGKKNTKKKEIVDEIKSILTEHRSSTSELKPVNTTGLDKRKQVAAQLDDKLERSDRVRVGKPEYEGWSDSLKENARTLGKGRDGTVILNPEGEVVKRGNISSLEAHIIDRVGKADLGPKLIAADLGGPADRTDRSVELRIGRIAMTKVPGEPLDRGWKNDKVANAYWKARADLHRMGIAHNDIHGTNVFMDKSLKVRFIDMGLAQDNPKAALVEALGAFCGPKGKRGDWQFYVWGVGSGLIRELEEKGLAQEQITTRTEKLRKGAPFAYTVFTNKAKAIEKLKDMGFTQVKIDQILNTEIRRPKETYEKGVWAKLSDKQAMEVINTLYEGI